MRPILLSSGFTTLAQLSTSPLVQRQYDTITSGIDRTQYSFMSDSNNNDNPAYRYPTDLTRDIIPKPIHSHNDYWREVPFFTALSNGCTSVEADVWLFNETLYVGHDILSLTKSRTFDSLYIQPILSVLNRQNPPGEIVPDDSTKYGVFDTSGATTLHLFVDVKTDGPTTWPFVVKALQPLRDRYYLTTFNHSTTVSGPITVIGTGNTPLDQIKDVPSRDYFFDAGLTLLSSTQSDITSDISPIASSDFSKSVGKVGAEGLSETQRKTIRDHLAVAKSKGIGGRYYETPAWPVSTRNMIWRFLVEEGVALLNADDLAAAAGYSGPPW